MFHATTILGYLGKRHNEACAVIGGDGQVSFGSSILKGNAIKIRRLCNNKVLAGFAGSTADAFSLFDMFERVLDSKKGDLVKSAMEFSKEWRRDKYLRKLEAMMIVMDLKHVFILTGSGDVVEPEDGRIAAIGSGGNYALSAARALDKFACMDPKELVTESLRIASGICVYTNACIKTVEITQEQRIDDAQQDA